MPAGLFNGVLIQATDAQIYHIDALEVLDTTGTTIGTATNATLFGDHVGNLTNAAGAPNGVLADTQATATNKASNACGCEASDRSAAPAEHGGSTRGSGATG